MTLDVRILAATNLNLERAIAEGRFREDLYYRLNVLPLPIPALREHREDVPELVGFYVDWMVEKERLPYRRFTTGALNVLRNHAWPGNIRELKNLVQRLLILSQGEEVTDTDVAAALGAQKTMVSEATIPAALFDLPMREARDHFEKAYLEHHLKLAGGNVGDVAATVGMERTHLYRKLKGLGIDLRKASLQIDSHTKGAKES